MKLKTYLSLLVIATTLGISLASAETKAKSSSQGPFHIAKSDAEKVLDEILRRADKDRNIFDYVLGHPWYDHEKGTGYSHLFTKNLLRTLAKEEAEFVKYSCDGKYLEGELCGFDYSPITCAQDFSEQGYIYWTKKDNGHKAIIYYLWSLADKTEEFFPGSDITDKNKNFYKLIKDDGHWKLDGVDCGNGAKFNMN